MQRKLKSIFILILLFMIVGGFSIIPFILQAATFNPSTQTPIQLPDINIVDYELTPQQENAILQQGKTIVKLQYNLNCESCLGIKTLLDQMANEKQFKDQLLVEEIVSPSGDLPKVNIIGFVIADNQLGVDQKTMQGVNATQDEIMNSLCDLMLQPPVGCALRNV